MSMKILHVKFIVVKCSSSTLSLIIFCIGLVISKDYQFIAATHNGFRQCTCCGEGVVEIKCPHCTKDSNPELAVFLKDGSLPSSDQ